MLIHIAKNCKNVPKNVRNYFDYESDLPAENDDLSMRIEEEETLKDDQQVYETYAIFEEVNCPACQTVTTTESPYFRETDDEAEFYCSEKCLDSLKSPPANEQTEEPEELSPVLSPPTKRQLPKSPDQPQLKKSKRLHNEVICKYNLLL
jgi:hypothetical protein